MIQRHKSINTISYLAAEKGFQSTSTGRDPSDPDCSLQLQVREKEKTYFQTMRRKSSMFRLKCENRGWSSRQVNTCLPFLDVVCASSILRRIEGHFIVVLAFDGKSERRLRVCVHKTTTRRSMRLNRYLRVKRRFQEDLFIYNCICAFIQRDLQLRDNTKASVQWDLEVRTRC